MIECHWLAEGYRGRRYWLSGEQLAKINGVVRKDDPLLFDVFEVCDLLKQIEYDQLIEEAMDLDEPCCDNECVGWAYDDREGWRYHTELMGKWYFPDSDVWLDEVKPSIQVEALEQGFLIRWRGVELAFTDRVDAAEWLLGWLGFEDEIVESVRDILEGLWDADELYDILSDCVAGLDYDEVEDGDCTVAHIALAAWAFIEEVEDGGFGEDGQYQKLVKAVKKWRGIEGR